MEKIIGASERVQCALHVNGQRYELQVSPSQLLIDVLRDELGLTGTKLACGMANCGACTVLLDGVPVYSCITLALDCVGREITTVEGLARGDELHPIQRAFIEEDGFQCGFCTSGQIMALAGYLKDHHEPTEDDLRRALAGNLCRCGAYVKIVKSGMRAAQLLREQPEARTQIAPRRGHRPPSHDLFEPEIEAG